MSNKPNNSAASAARVTLKNVRFSYLNVLEPRSINGSKPKYSACLIFSKEDAETVKAVRYAIKAAYEAGSYKLTSGGKAVTLKDVHSPLHDGDIDKAGEEAYENAWYINASSVEAPAVVNRHAVPVTSADEIHSGDYGNAVLTFYAYNAGGNKGIAAGLEGLQVVKRGPRLGGRLRAADLFSAVASADDDEDEEELPF